MTDIFISYRRTNAFEVERIHEKLTSKFPAARIFLDREDLSYGEEFPQRIRTAAEKAPVMLVVLGRDWASVQDATTLKRRIELKDDWVRQEVELGLAGKRAVIPVLLEGAEMPTNAQLPKTLRPLTEYHAIRLSYEHFNVSTDELIAAITTHLGNARAEKLKDGAGRKYPDAAQYRPVALSEDQLREVAAQLPHWKLVESPLEDDDRFPGHRMELVREFRFASFLDAIAFMHEASISIDSFGHHPRWENVFRTVTVRLSTFDIGHRVSERDQVCARMIERLYAKFNESHPP